MNLSDSFVGKNSKFILQKYSITFSILTYTTKFYSTNSKNNNSYLTGWWEMNKKIGVPFIITACFAIILFSYISWNIKLDNIEKDATKVIPISTDSSGSEDKSSEQNNNTNSSSLSEEDLKKALKNSSTSVQNLFEKRYKDGQTVKMLILGSQAMDQGGEGYAKLLKDSLQETYGDFVNVSAQSFNTTSAEFIDTQMKDVKWSTKYDIVLLEPFILNDNGLVSTEDEFSYIGQIVTTIQDEVKDAVVVLQPSFPIYGASYYETNVAALKSYAKENSLPYINHWTEWPSSSDESLKDYIIADKEQPNKAGTNLWAKALSKYFTNH